MVNKFNYIIYHKNCLDGFTGFLLFTLTNMYSNNSYVYPDIPAAKSIPPDIKGKDIIIIDVAYSKDILENIFKLANKVLFIDHHITIKEYVHELGKKYNKAIFFNEKYSACGLVWKFFNSKKKLPKFVEFIQDNDIGEWKLKDTKKFISGLHVNYKLDPSFNNLKTWKKLFNDSEVSKLIKLGSYYEDYKNYLILENSKRYSKEKFPSQKIYNINSKIRKIIDSVGKYKVIVYNGNCPSVTSIGTYFYENFDCDFVWIWTLNLSKKEIIVSLRANKENVDVGKIASCFGGGGHIGAAAFSININYFNIQDFFM